MEDIKVLHVYKQSELDNANQNGIVQFNVYIHGVEDVSLKNIREVKGYLGIKNIKNIDLCDIVEIGGDFWIGQYDISDGGPQTINLSKLERVEGSFIAPYASLRNLGVLVYVGENANLKNTQIDNLSKLSYIGGNLSLPNRLKGKIDLSNVFIGGSTKYFKPSSPNIKIDNSITASDRKIPVVNPKNLDGWIEHYIETIEQATPEQVEFYNYFRDCFYNGIIIDVRGVLEYPKLLLQSMMKDLSKPLPLWLNDYDRLIGAYPELDQIAAYHFKSHSTRYDIGWELCKRQQSILVSHIGFFEEKLSKKLFNVDFLIKIGGCTEMSPWAKQHLEDIKPFIQQEIDKFEKKWDRQFLRVFVDPSLNPNEQFEFYKQFYLYETSFNWQNERGDFVGLDKFIPKDYDKMLPTIVDFAIKDQCKKFAIDAEDAYRDSIGMPRIGEFWRSETELFYSIKEAFNRTEVVHHSSPSWLGRQHLDIYFPKFNIGIEYQGEQHYKPVDFFGGEDAFIKSQERDKRKKYLCEKNNCALIYVNQGYNLIDVIEEIKSKMGIAYIDAITMKKTIEPSILEKEHITDSQIELEVSNSMKTEENSNKGFIYILKQKWEKITSSLLRMNRKEGVS